MTREDELRDALLDMVSERVNKYKDFSLGQQWELIDFEHDRFFEDTLEIAAMLVSILERLSK